jgi:acylphosphatase
VKRVRVIVAGRVQGVFFRTETADRARSLGLAGSVHNRPDGGVEAVFEGDEERVEELVRWCERGPAGARVDTVNVEPEEPLGERGFSIV